MSKTIRRKNYSRDLSWVLRDWDFSEPEFNVGRRIRIDPHSKEGKKRLAKYHSDAARFMGNAPHWYCNMEERSIRGFNKSQVFKWLCDSSYEVQCLGRHRHSATYSWW